MKKRKELTEELTEEFRTRLEEAEGTDGRTAEESGTGLEESGRCERKGKD